MRLLPTVRKIIRKFGKFLLRSAIFLMLLVVFGALTIYVALRTMVTPEGLKSVIVSQLQDVFHRPVQVQDVRVLLHQGIRIRGLRVIEAPGYPNREFLFSDVVVAKYRWRALLRRRLELNEIQLVNPRIQLIRGENGHWNVEDIFASSAAARMNRDVTSSFLPVSFVADVISIDHGVIAYQDLKRGKNVNFQDLTLRIHDFDLHDPFSISSSFETTAELGGPWPAKARGTLRGSMALSGFHWEDASLSADKLTMAIDDYSMSASGTLWNFRHPEIKLRLRLPKVNSGFLMKYVAVPAGVTVPAGQCRLHLSIPSTDYFRLEQLDYSAGDVKAGAEGFFRNLPGNSAFELTLTVPQTPLDQASELWHGWQKYQLSGAASGKVVISGDLDKPAALTIERLYFKLDSASGIFAGKHRITKVDAEIKAGKNLDNIAINVTKGSAILFDNPFSAINMALRFNSGDLNLDRLDVMWNSSKISLKSEVKNFSHPKAVLLEASADKVKIEDLVSAVTKAMAQYKPSAPRPRTGPWSRIFRYSIPKTFPATAGHLRVGELVHPNFDCFNLDLLWDLRGISTGLKQVSGNVRVGFGPGRVTDIPKLGEENKILRVVFLPFVFMHRLNNLTVISAATAYPNDLDFTRIYGEYGLKNGLVDVRVFHVDSGQLQAYSDGTVDFPKEKINLHMLTRMTHARGTLPEYLTDEKGRPSIGFFVEDDLNKPSLRIDYHKMEKDAIEKALQRGLRRSKVIFPHIE